MTVKELRQYLDQNSSDNREVKMLLYGCGNEQLHEITENDFYTNGSGDIVIDMSFN